MAKNPDTKAEHTLIAAGVQVKGNLNCSNDLWFDGIIVGNIDCAGAVMVGPRASVSGNITCDNLTVEGQVQGNLHVRGSLNIGDLAVIKGDIKTRTLEVKDGAYLSGNLEMSDEKPESNSKAS